LGEGELNIFAGIFKNPLFLTIVVLTVVIQMAIVEIGQLFTKTSALNTKQNLICLAFGAGELLWGLVIKQFDSKYFAIWQLDEPAEDENAATEEKLSRKSGGSYSSALKRQKTTSMRA